MHGSREMALLPLVALAHVEEERGLVAPEQGQGVRSLDLLDLGLHLLEQLAVVRHCFQEYSYVAFGNKVAWTAPIEET